MTGFANPKSQQDSGRCRVYTLYFLSSARPPPLEHLRSLPRGTSKLSRLMYNYFAGLISHKDLMSFLSTAWSSVRNRSGINLIRRTYDSLGPLHSLNRSTLCFTSPSINNPRAYSHDIPREFHQRAPSTPSLHHMPRQGWKSYILQRSPKDPPFLGCRPKVRSCGIRPGLYYNRLARPVEC